MLSSPSNCFLIALASVVLMSPSESDWPSSIDSKSIDLVVVDVMSAVSSPKTAIERKMSSLTLYKDWST